MSLIDQTEEEEAVSEETGTSEEYSESNEVDASSDEGTSEEETNSTSEDEKPREDEWLVPGRIKTKEDLLQAYRNLESAYGQRGNELHELRRNSQTKKLTPEQEIAAFAADIQKNPVEAVRNIVRNETEEARIEAKKVRFETEYHRLKSNKEFVELEPVMDQIAVQYSDMIRDNNLAQDPRLLHILFYAARGAKQDQLAATAEARGQRKGESDAKKKVKAQVEGASGSKGHAKKNFEELSLEEMKKEIARGNVG